MRLDFFCESLIVNVVTPGAHPVYAIKALPIKNIRRQSRKLNVGVVRHNSVNEVHSAYDIDIAAHPYVLAELFLFRFAVSLKFS